MIFQNISPISSRVVWFVEIYRSLYLDIFFSCLILHPTFSHFCLDFITFRHKPTFDRSSSENRYVICVLYHFLSSFIFRLWKLGEQIEKDQKRNRKWKMDFFQVVQRIFEKREDYQKYIMNLGKERSSIVNNRLKQLVEDIVAHVSFHFFIIPIISWSLNSFRIYLDIRDKFMSLVLFRVKQKLVLFWNESDAG